MTDPVPYAQTEAGKRATRARKRLLAVVGGGVAVLLLVGVGIGIGVAVGNGGRHRSDAASKPTASATPSSRADTPDPVAKFKITAPVLKQQTTVAAMDAMSLEDFAKLPYADRLAYAYAKSPNMPVVTPDQNVPTDLIPGHFWGGLGILNWDNPDDAAKFASAMLYYTTANNSDGPSDAYKAVIVYTKEYAKPGAGGGDTYVYVDSAKMQSGKDRSGNPIDFVDVTYHQADATSGKRLQQNMTSQAVRCTVRLLGGRELVYYPLAYSVDGKASPDSDYPY